MSKPTSNTPTDSTSIFSQMDSAQRKAFHSLEAQRERNRVRSEAREEAKSKGKVYDVGLRWKQSQNVEGISEATNDTTGNDEFTLASKDSSKEPSRGDPSGSQLKGVLVYRAGETTPDFISVDEVLANYDPTIDDDWSLKFSVTSSTLDAFSGSNPVGTNDDELFDGNAATTTAQTFYSIPVVRAIGSEKYSFNIAGVYRENIFCAGSKGAIVELIKIG